MLAVWLSEGETRLLECPDAEVVGVIAERFTGMSEDFRTGMCSMMSSSRGRPWTDEPPMEREREYFGSAPEDVDGRVSSRESRCCSCVPFQDCWVVGLE